MRSTPFLVTFLGFSSCALLAPAVASASAPLAAPAPAGDSDAGTLADASLVDAGEPIALTEVDDEAPAVTADATMDDDEGLEEGEVAPPDSGYLYTAELSDAELARLWKDAPASLGSVSVGLVQEGRLINAMPFPEGDAWIVVVPESCWTTKETADFIIAAARDLRAQFPEAPPVRVGQVSGKEGGYLRPHVTHQNGRDVDVGLFYPGTEPYRVRARETVMDVALNWAFLKAIVVNGDVQGILLDKRVQKVLYGYALAHGEDRAWLDSLFNAGPRSLVHHARKHRDHFHIRYFNPRAQELAWRLAPLMSMRVDQNIAFHRVQKGDTLGAIAHRMGSTVKKLREANHLTDRPLRIGVVLKVPLRGPCTNCPVPPHVVAPPRRLPPGAQVGGVFPGP